MNKTITLWASAVLLVLSVSQAEAARRSDPVAEKFVKNFSDDIIRIIRDRNSKFSTRSTAIRSLLLKHTDSKRIAVFMLGRYARKIDTNLLDQYVHLMEDYAMRVFVNRILRARNAHTAKLAIINSTPKGSKGKEVIVLSKLTAKGFKEPVQIRWWLVRNKKGVFKIFNISVEGFWLAQEQRSQFTSFIQKNNGDPKVLLPFLREKIKQAEQDTKKQDIQNLRRR